MHFKMEANTTKTSLRTAALIAGLALITMAIAAPIAELFVYPKLVNPWNVSESIKNILANQTLFRTCILCYLLTFICDILAAWALYILLKPVNGNLSILAALFRIVYAVIAIVALSNLVTVLKILTNPDYIKTFQPNQLTMQINLSLNAFQNGWDFGIIFFGIHLEILGYLVFRSNYIPKIMGILLIIAGLGYLANALKPFLFPDITLDFAKFTFYGELIFMLWLLIKGSRMKELN
jgi:hypothetical protein